MPARWLSNSSDAAGRTAAALEDMLHNFSRPDRIRRLRQVLVVLLVLWAVLALARLLWALLPAPDVTLPGDAVVLNPIAVTAPAARTDPVDIERLMAWHLFGEADALSAPETPETAAQTGTSTARDGIEKNARETRLDLKLRGIVASSEDGLGHAIIEYRSQQAIYAVEDKLPLPGQVVLAKVMPTQVVLDNGGTYELLQLFDDSEVASSLLLQLPRARAGRAAPTRSSADSAMVDMRTDTSATELARSYRQRLYQNPQSLAAVVTVSAVRENGELLGYRIAPGKDREQFEQLGFKPGDMVTSVNGIALDDPANTVRLYQTMRSASEAVFDLERNDQPLTLSVSLDSGTAGR